MKEEGNRRGIEREYLVDFDLFGYNNIGAEGGKVIGEALKVNTSLTEIDLQYNKIGDEGAKAIGEALKVNTSLTGIYLQYNKIGDEGERQSEGIESEYFVD